MGKKRERKLEYRDLKPIIKARFKEYLEMKLQDEGLGLPEAYQGKYSFGAYTEPGNDDQLLFNLIVTGERPEDAIVILEATVKRVDGSIGEWRCYDDAFINMSSSPSPSSS